MIYTVRSMKHGTVLGYYGTFADEATADLVAQRCAERLSREHGTAYKGVLLPAGERAKPLHHTFTDGITT